MFLSNLNATFRSICPRDKDRKSSSEMLLDIGISVQRPLYQDKSNNMQSKKIITQTNCIHISVLDYFLVLKIFWVFHFI
jgi:hypothetical protein